MLHTISDLLNKVQAMLVLAEAAHKEKSKSKNYDTTQVTYLVENIQAMAGDIYNDKQKNPRLIAKEKREKNQDKWITGYRKWKNDKEAYEKGYRTIN